jgi:hypothetical protein
VRGDSSSVLVIFRAGIHNNSNEHIRCPNGWEK